MQRQNVPSSLITDDVNNEIFALLGEKSFTFATGFAEIFTENETHDNWLRLDAGVICYVKDYSQRNVTLRFFDTNGAIREIWSTLVAPEELFAKDTANFVVYERGDGVSFGINFADTNEAERFYTTVRELQSKRPRRNNSVRNDEPNDTSASASLCDSLASSRTSETRKSSASSFADDLSSAVSRNRASETSTRAISPASEQCHSSKYQSQAIKWEHEGTFRRFTLHYDDSCDAYQKLREHINRIQRKFKSRLAWKDCDGDWIEFASDSELRHAIAASNCKDIFYIKTIDGAPEEDSPKSSETKKSLFSSVSSAFSQAFEKPPPLDKRDIGKPTKFRHLIHMTSNGDILQGYSKYDTK